MQTAKVLLETLVDCRKNCAMLTNVSRTRNLLAKGKKPISKFGEYRSGLVTFANIFVPTPTNREQIISHKILAINRI